MDALRYSRQIALPQWGEAGQARLAAAQVLLVGLGGLGSPAALYLAAAGVGRIVLNDFDTVDRSNLARQILYVTADDGRRKSDAATEALSRLNPDVQVHALDRRLDAAGLRAEAAAADVVLDGSDNFATRFAVNGACVATGTPLVSGAAVRGEGQLAVFTPGRDDSPCYRCLYDEGGEDVGDCRGHGVFSPLVGVIGSLMAVEALKLLLGAGLPAAGRVCVYDALAGEFRHVRLARDPHCPACSG